MEIIITQNFAESSQRVAAEIAALVQAQPNAKLGLATGGSAEGVYAELLRRYRAGGLDFSNISSVNLDEYVGLAPANEQSYSYYMQQHLFEHININMKNSYVPDGSADPAAELKIFAEKLHAGRRVDLQLLGVGANGHIGFNEPSAELRSGAHIEDLVESTVEANARYFAKRSEVPRQAFTQGIGDILKAKHLVLIASGAQKAGAIKELLSHDKVTTQCPVTLLKLHPSVSVFIDRDLADAAQ